MKDKKMKSKIPLIVLMFFLHNFTYAQAKIEKPTQLAILKFLNNTGSKDSDWIQNSLTDAFDVKMRENFIFERPDAEQIQEYR